MKIAVSALICLLSASAFATQNSFEEYVGCYDTLTLNGEAIPTNSESKYLNSEIKHDDAFFYADVNGSVIPSMSLTLYQGFTNDEGGTHNFDVHEAFLDRGTFSKGANESAYSYKGDVSYRFQPEIKWELTSKITITPIDSTHISVRADRTIIGNTPGDLDVSDTYVLQQKSCN